MDMIKQILKLGSMVEILLGVKGLSFLDLMNTFTFPSIRRDSGQSFALNL